MTTEEAIRILYDGSWWDSLDTDISDADWEPLDEAPGLAIAALRAQQERENPKPLTLEELREMDAEPVYLLVISGRLSNMTKNAPYWSFMTEVLVTLNYGLSRSGQSTDTSRRRTDNG